MVEPGTLARLALFADLASPQIEALAHMMEEASFGAGTRVLRSGLLGNAFYVVTNGEAVVLIDGEERARLGAGDFFGEVSILTGEPAGADVVAASEELRCGVLPGAQLRELLLAYPQVSVRMLEAGARRLRSANRWAG
jgi:CRP-like cAMP-binding protein